MITFLAAAALTQASLGAAPSASQPVAAPPAAAATPKPAADKVICHSEPQLGSMFSGPKECHTKSEWDAINAASRDNMSNYQQRSNQAGSPR